MAQRAPVRCARRAGGMRRGPGRGTPGPGPPRVGGTARARPRDPVDCRGTRPRAGWRSRYSRGRGCPPAPDAASRRPQAVTPPRISFGQEQLPMHQRGSPTQNTNTPAWQLATLGMSGRVYQEDALARAQQGPPPPAGGVPETAGRTRRYPPRRTAGAAPGSCRRPAAVGRRSTDLRHSSESSPSA